MPERSRNAAQRRSRRKLAIEPVRIEELRTGAGMTGYLGILEAPAAAPHLQRLARKPLPVSSEETEASASLSRGVRRQLERRGRELDEILDRSVRIHQSLARAVQQAEAWLAGSITQSAGGTARGRTAVSRRRISNEKR